MEFSVGGGVTPIRQNNEFFEKNIVVGKKPWKLFKMVWNMKICLPNYDPPLFLPSPHTHT